MLLRLSWLAAGLLCAETVSIRNSLDQAQQKLLVELPSSTDKPVPLLVHLHSWSSTFDRSGDMDVARQESRKRGWAFVSPDFRGPNDKPEACGSELSVQDILDAVAYMKQRAPIDERRIYLLGSSGGGYMTLVMAARAPHLWAAASAWVPIADLPAWHASSKAKQSNYWKMLEACFGGPPGSGRAVQAYRRRSPVYFLGLARGLALDINTGIQDGHTGSVPVSHSLRAFNALAPAERRISARDIESITASAKVPPHLAAEVEKEERKRPILFRRSAGGARITVFDGGHEGDFPTAIAWLERHRRAAFSPELSLKDNQVLQRDEQKRAVVPMPAGDRVQVRVNGGPWSSKPAVLPTGGPYRLDFRALDAAGVELGRRTRSGVFVGDVYLLAGQSNMVGRAPLPSHVAPDPRVLVMTPEDTWDIARDPLHEAVHRDGREIGTGLGLPFAKEMVRRTGVPVGLIPCAVGGTSLEEWNPDHRARRRRSLYGNLLARAKMAGGRFRAILWYQGEADAGGRDTAATYTDRFLRWVQTLRTDLAQPDLPIYVAQLGRVVAGSDGWNVVRESQRLVDKSIPNAGMVATIDLTLTDNIHLDGPSQARLGRRFASRILDGPGPQPESVVWEGPYRLRVKLSHPVRTSSDRVHGFELSVPALFHAMVDAKTGDVLLDVRMPPKPPEKLELWYGRGPNPVCNLTTARDMALPAFGPFPVPPSGVR